MKKSYLFAAALFATTALFTTSCGPSDEDIKNAIAEAEASLDELEEEEDDLFTSEDGKFSINFFGTNPVHNSTAVPTDLGSIQMESFMYEKSATEAYMVAYSDYPSAYVDESEGAQDLLQGAKNGALGNLGIFSTDQEEETELDGHPGLFFTGNNGQYFVTYEVYLVSNRLYQIAIIRDGSYAAKEDVETFMESFALNAVEETEE